MLEGNHNHITIANRFQPASQVFVTITRGDVYSFYFVVHKFFRIALVQRGRPTKS